MSSIIFLRKKLEKMGEPYKVELCGEHAGKGENISFYKQGDFTDLCAGPHLMNTSAVKAFKLTACTGAYWRGDAKGKQLSRIYGTAFPKASELEAHLAAAITINWDANWNISPPLIISVRDFPYFFPRAQRSFRYFSAG